MKILIVDDEVYVGRFLSDFIKTINPGIEIRTAGKVTECLGIFEEFAPDIILLDIHLPDGNGIDVLHNLKERGGRFEVLMISGNASLEDAVQAIKYGAYDFLLKPFSDLQILEKSIVRAIDSINLKIQNELLLSELSQKNVQLEELNRRLHSLSVSDDLTGLYNMRFMNEFISKEIIRAKRYNRTFAIILLDLDSLKSVNDRYGHLAGSTLIKSVADLLMGMVRKSDTVARFGGDEYLIFADELNVESARGVGERIRERIEKLSIEFEGNHLSTTASVGIACFPDDGSDFKQLFSAADSAMYYSKNNGKNRVSLAKDIV
ncbi:MAG: diguanylate cyclase [Deltaproteobacteria bacterium]|nr:diguanylate cyclase [Deltaproteobacteria bacterium]